MNSIKSIGRKLSSGTAEIYSSLKETFNPDRSESNDIEASRPHPHVSGRIDKCLQSEVQEVRLLMKEELKLEREAREMARRRSTAPSISTASSFTISGGPSRSLSALGTPRDSLMSLDEDLFADFESQERIFEAQSDSNVNPFVSGLRDIDKIDECASSLSELSDSALKNVIRQLLVLRPAALHSLKEALN